MNKTLHKYKWFWGWDDEREEDWLRKMAQSGWHLQSVAPFGAYTFSAGPKTDVIYRLDFQPLTKKQDRLEYYQLFVDAGWERAAEIASWQYFRKPPTAGGASNIFTDQASRIGKYQRLCGLLTLFMIILVILSNNIQQAAERYGPWFTIPLIIYVIVLGLYIYTIVRLVVRISRLKKLEKTRQ